MASIGPQLPPHLQKRKRTPDDDDDHKRKRQSPPPPNVARRANDREHTSNNNTSRPPIGPQAAPSPPSIGPMLPPALASSDKRNSTTTPSARPRQPIGPALPPANSEEIPLDSDSDSDVGPAPPPRTIGPTLSPAAPTTTTTTTNKRVLGPAPPPADLSTRPTTNPDSDSDSDSDWGPALPSSTTDTRYPSRPAAQPTESSAPKRDDWMVAPPEPTGYQASDPTKLKSRKFASGRSARTEKPGGGGGGGSGISSIWTETPEEKLRRLTNAVLGREDPAGVAGPAAPAKTAKDEKNRVDEAWIRSYTEQTRGRSLVEEHEAARAAGKRLGGKGKKGEDDDEDDPSKRAFDREKDMAIGGRLDNSKRRELLTRAADFGGRFQKGNYL
ncbi:hypothetical protein B0T22DRAFT_533576 [Podospora appendiculata]|uniref:DUF3752 domain-containing protein n=1 Tax=Podospora appendiculata TaxID=314037 RepID=A0AAE0XJD9_9PEZI|nr:hypothetical protein B0T22DRAFT_533576 [Podospora appendiculata]